MKKIILSILCAFMFFSLAASSLTAYAAPKNTVTTSVSKVESKAKSFKVTWKKKSKINGYQIQYSTSSKFKKKETKTKTITKAKTTSATVSKLKGCNIKYYVRVRTYKIVNGKKIYSSWSKTKSVTTLKHKYSKATCTKAKTCKYCGKTSGKKLGHKWSSATCTKAKTCSLCKKTSGEKLGHKWSAATCTKAKTCSLCKKTSGEALGHKWSVATCTKAKTCSRCKKTSGEALGHKWSSWSTVIAAEVGKNGTQKRTCSKCQKHETKTIPALKEDYAKKWFVTQYNVAKQQYISSLNSSISTKQATIDDLRDEASALYVNYMKEEQRIRERYASTPGTLERALRDAQLNYNNLAQVYTNQIKSLESEITDIKTEIANPNVDNILAIVTKNCNISSKETYEYYYKYSNCI